MNICILQTYFSLCCVVVVRNHKFKSSSLFLLRSQYNVCVFVYVCVRERDREREREAHISEVYVWLLTECVCMLMEICEI